MTKLVLLITLLLMVGFAFSQSDQQSAIGIVKSESGKPLSDVLVCARTYECLKTDSEGRYDLHKLFPGKWDTLILQRVIARFSREGYQSQLKTFENTPPSFDVTLSEGNATPWVIPPCAPNEERQGFRFKVLVPKGTKIAKGRDIDYVTVNFRYRNSAEWMMIGSGLNWSSGLPFPPDVRAAVTIVDREIVLPLQRDQTLNSVDGIDVRGQLKDGKRWRYTGRFGETLSYRNSSEAAAKFFDSIIDSACYSGPKQESK